MTHDATAGPVALSLLVVRVDDLEVSRRFYENLGFAFRSERHGGGPRHLSTQLGGAVIELYPRGSGPSTEGLRLGFEVGDIGAVTARCRSSVLEDSQRDGCRIVVLRDPDGHKIELTEPPPSS